MWEGGDLFDVVMAKSDDDDVGYHVVRVWEVSIYLGTFGRCVSGEVPWYVWTGLCGAYARFIDNINRSTDPSHSKLIKYAQHHSTDLKSHVAARLSIY
jgi:hypothetical protein